MDEMGFPATNIILAVFLIYTYIKGLGKISFYEFTYICFIVGLVFYQKSILPIVLLAPLVAYKNVNRAVIYDFQLILLKTRWIHLALISTVFYSLYYGLRMTDGRFLHTGVYEVNTSGLAVFLLGLVYLKRNKIIGKFVLLFGCLSFSRNYYLALIIYFFFNLKWTRKKLQEWEIDKRVDFKTVTILSVFFLYTMGVLSESIYEHGGVVYAESFVERVRNVIDLSNYYRFTTNLYLIRIWREQPMTLLLGISTEKFRLYCTKIAMERKQLYANNNPHNFFFSYTKLFGIAGVMDMLYVSRILKKVVDINNFSIFLVICCYTIFLSLGVNGEWLFWTLGVLGLYYGDNSLEYFWK
ncbi:MAG: hypothetical protein NC131_13880 [Roseburia sp.]|nr:hypothetical protein [Roseburia sp.]